MSYERSVCHALRRMAAQYAGARVSKISTITLSRDPCGQVCGTSKLSTISLSHPSRSFCHGYSAKPTISLSRNPIVKNL